MTVLDLSSALPQFVIMVHKGIYFTLIFFIASLTVFSKILLILKGDKGFTFTTLGTLHNYYACLRYKAKINCILDYSWL